MPYAKCEPPTCIGCIYAHIEPDGRVWCWTFAPRYVFELGTLAWNGMGLCPDYAPRWMWGPLDVVASLEPLAEEVL